MKMNILQGTVNKVRFSTEVTGTDNSISTSQIAVFELDGKQVELKLPDSIIINNGDRVVVAGELKKGLFKALAYKNITNGVSGKRHVLLYYFIGIIFTVVGLPALFVGIGFLFIPLGLYCIYCGKQNAKAYQLVEHC